MAIVLEKFVSALAGTLFTLVKDEIVFVLGVQDEIERLLRRLERVLPILADADLRRLQDTAIEAWVRQLKDVAYDADDIIDECRIEAEKRSRSKKPLSSSSSSLSVSCLSSLLCCFSRYGVHRCHQIGNKINRLNQKLDDIIKDLPFLSLRSTPIYPNVESGISSKTSPLVEPDLVGKRIKEDTRMLADMLLSQEYKNQHKVSVFAIIRMGGIGKTTLAQKIYNDEKLRAEFNHIPPIWVCVSQNFSEIDLLRAIITRAGGNPRESRDKEDLEPMFHEVVKDKRFFLILDDVWDGKVWENLLYKPLSSASLGSRVLVTTRHESVAMQMRAVYRHQVERLSDKDGWLLLCKMVFPDGVDGVEKVKSLRDIGMRIVKKCDGLPLAVKVIAGVLRNKSKSLLDWEGVLQNPAWTLTELPDGVMGALYLSYLELPSHLKQCFLYFAFFPEDAEHFIMDMVSLWTAEGFVEAKGNKLMEELAEECWEELINRSLLQPNDTHFKSMLCKMHDLLHTLAQHIASDECFNWDLQKFRENSISSSSLHIKSRRIFSEKGDETIPDIIREHMTLRTLSIQFLSSFPEDAIVKFKCLRVVDVQYLSANSLPNSIGDLIHLRYLNLSFSEINEIPESIGNLCNLQVLIIYECTNLQNLPKAITKLHSYLLDLRDSGFSRLPIGSSRFRVLQVTYWIWEASKSCSTSWILRV